MKVKELRKKYEGYDLQAFGKPLELMTIPFTHLPKGKDLDDCEVVDYKIVDKEFDSITISKTTLKINKIEKKKGHVLVYVR